ncbi:antibiotic biosynthesis monooxygenase family protein [Oceanobacillus chungangensis]|uniref:Antibiotic biosynthesis monooxygenase n=1 Tax=Oceanobacillus chungangensis TaxID=1229152 RepID=A0A3D8PVY1_9BACI|nr:antibiotic biosynthesis monooxygenase [Oceanobacillus chungangensis]RDW19912.1 antibiotic biosynthesis monooxygenase [Oceanobacillus chungangensis]
MKAFMTNGTIDFLLKLEEKHRDIQFYFMTNSENGAAYYENSSKNVFNAGREYEVISETGEMKKEGFIVMNNIPVQEEEQPAFEYRFKNSKNAVDAMPGFEAFRLLRPVNGNTYVVLTQWHSSMDFNNWKNSDQFKKAHKKQSAKPAAYFPERPFVTTYQMYLEEE